LCKISHIWKMTLIFKKDIIISIKGSLIGGAVILVIMYVKNFNTD